LFSFETKNKQPWKKVTAKKNMMKVEEGEVDGDEKSKKNWKDYDVEALITLCGEMELEFVKNVFKR
jgi:hypothetical protein